MPLAEYGFMVDVTLPLLNVGRRERPVYIAAELVDILPGQPLKTKLTPAQQDAMIGFACRAPPENAQSITTSARKLLGLDSNPLLPQFGITVDKNLVTVLGRELLPPKLSYTGGTRVEPKDGGWLMKGVKVAKQGRRIEKWNYLYFAGTNSGVAKQTASGFANFMAQRMGININVKPISPNGVACQLDENAIRTTMANLAKLGPPQLIVVFLPDKDSSRYNLIKELGDCVYGIHTVCAATRIHIEQGQAGFFANVGLKVNLKFGGINHKLISDNGLISKGKTMVVGYDVTHPTNLASGAGENAPSIAGLVSSIDSHLSQWPAYVWNMKGKTEMLNKQLVPAFKHMLQLWQKNPENKGLPDKLVIFRDGVSEGQFNQVNAEEVPFIRQACREIYGAKSLPRITLVVSVKRHQTRFYPTDQNHTHHKSKSPKEGTIVDCGVTSVRYWDFFLQAHASMQGKCPVLFRGFPQATMCLC